MEPQNRLPAATSRTDVQAVATRTPTPEERASIEFHLKWGRHYRAESARAQGRGDLREAQYNKRRECEEFQAAADKSARLHGIDTSNCKGQRIAYDPDLGPGEYGQAHPKDRSTCVGPDAMDSQTKLATTQVHEATHANQIAIDQEKGMTADQILARRDVYEIEACDAENHSAERTGLDRNPDAASFTSDYHKHWHGNYRQSVKDGSADARYYTPTAAEERAKQRRLGEGRSKDQPKKNETAKLTKEQERRRNLEKLRSAAKSSPRSRSAGKQR